jgi:uncharacterized membrane protein
VINRLVKETRLLLIVAYPVMIYLLLSYQIAWLGALLVFAIIVWQLHKRDNWLTWALVMLVGVLLSARLFGTDAALKMSPLFIHGSLFTVFTQSLYNTPLIERFARLEFSDELPSGIAAYCRKLTILWAAFFAANIAGVAWLAIRGDDATWMLYNGLVVYLLIGTLLLGEYLWRRIAFSELAIMPLAQTVRLMIANGDKLWEQEKHDAA